MISFTPITTFKEILGVIRKNKKADIPLVIGISGIERSGKTQFSQLLRTFLEKENLTIQIINLDDFLNPKEIRYKGKDLAKTYFKEGFNFKMLEESLLSRIKTDVPFSTEINVLNYKNDKYDTPKTYSFNKDTIVIIEGVFLLREELLSHINYQIYLDISFQESKRRAEFRDVPIYGAEILKISYIRYWPAQKRYIEEYHPREKSDMVIDYNVWEKPTIKYFL